MARRAPANTWCTSSPLRTSSPSAGANTTHRQRRGGPPTARHRDTVAIGHPSEPSRASADTEPDPDLSGGPQSSASIHKGTSSPIRNRHRSSEGATVSGAGAQDRILPRVSKENVLLAGRTPCRWDAARSPFNTPDTLKRLSPRKQDANKSRFATHGVAHSPPGMSTRAYGSRSPPSSRR